MEFKKEFTALIKKEYDKKYISYLEGLKEKQLSKKMTELIQGNNLTERAVKWNDFKVKLNKHLWCIGTTSKILAKFNNSLSANTLRFRQVE